jgi:AraC-like DNA-binding protein
VSFTFDPELCPAVAGFARAGGPRVLDGALGRRIAAVVNDARASLVKPAILAGVAEELLATFQGPVPRLDRRVARVVEVLRDPELDRADTLARLAISRAHLRALFARDVGVAMRTYILWRRLLHAIARVGPLDFTSSAHAAGFADLAHFSRTSRRMLGYSPSDLRGRLVTR